MQNIYPIALLLASRCGLLAGGVLFTLVLTQSLGAEKFGVIALSLTLFQAALVLGRGGLDQFTVRKASIYVQKGEVQNLENHAFQSAKFVVLSSAVIFLLYWLVSENTPIVDNAALKSCLSVLVFFILPFNFLACASAVFKSQKRPIAATVSDFTGVNAAAVLPVCALLYYDSLTVPGAIWSFALAGLALLAIYAPRLGIRFRLSHAGRPALAKLVRDAAPFYLVSLLDFVFLWAPILVLGALGTQIEVALLAAALRVARLTSLLTTLANTITMPMYSYLGDQKEPKLLTQVAAKSTLLTAIPAVVFLAACLIFSDSILAFFGPDFVQAENYLRLLVFAEVLGLIAGPLGPLLAMASQTSDIRNLQLFGAVSCLILQFVMVWLFGGIGACIGILFNMVLVNCVANVFCYRRLGITSFSIWSGILDLAREKYRETK
jgi:O-antigen/teichoic acid export membrane protein